MPVHRYAGLPACQQQRPVVPRAVRRATAAASKEVKENMHQQAEEAYAVYTRNITNISKDTGFPHSIVARVAKDDGKPEVLKRDVNQKNAWVPKRMEEINKGIVNSYCLLLNIRKLTSSLQIVAPTISEI
jgi:hypothetical protein